MNEDEESPVDGFQRGVLVGVALGLAGGLVVGLLVAPASGRRTRRRLARGAHHLSDRASAAVESAGERVRSGLRRE
jgi:gas vesicle protein